jgi:hypothetical protein
MDHRPLSIAGVSIAGVDAFQTFTYNQSRVIRSVLLWLQGPTLAWVPCAESSRRLDRLISMRRRNRSPSTVSEAVRRKRCENDNLA